MTTVPPPPIEAGRHWMILGQTGAGKTFWAKNYLLSRVRREIVVDTEEYDFPDEVWHPVKVSRAVDLAHSSKAFRVRVPMPMGNPGRDMLDELCLGLLKRGENVLLYIDELADFAHNGHVTDPVLAIVGKARKRGISFAGGSQRAQELPKKAYTQAKNHVFFYLDPADVFYWHDKAPYLPEKMPEIPFESYRWLYHGPGGALQVFSPVPKFDWEGQAKR
jgi:hypothetical protein